MLLRILVLGVTSVEANYMGPLFGECFIDGPLYLLYDLAFEYFEHGFCSEISI